MVLRDLATGGAVLLDFDALTLDPADLDAEAFRPRLPPRVRTQPVGEPERRAVPAQRGPAGLRLDNARSAPLSFEQMRRAEHTSPAARAPRAFEASRPFT
jgi:hypothetical protein